MISHGHGPDELCPEGTELYERALRDGRLTYKEVESTPCLIDFGLLYPDVDDVDWLVPTPPSVALPRLQRLIASAITLQREREVALIEAFEPLMAANPQASQPSKSLIKPIVGRSRINAAIGESMADATREVLTVQPGGTRPPELLAANLRREQAMLGRGGRMRTLYQHTTRHAPAVLAHYEQLGPRAEIRTLDEVPQRLIVIDGNVAYVPATADNSAALEVRHPALITFFITTFERLWRLATPVTQQPSPPERAQQGITVRQRAIAGLLVEGQTDAEIAARLGMNVRTVRIHVAKLAATLNSRNRAQLGYLIAQSGILDRID